MAVLEYREGEHSSGFVGFRVATTLGNGKEYKQKYFSIKQMPYEEAYRRALRQDILWRKQAEEVRRECKITRPGKPHIIARGFRAAISVENKKRRGTVRTYFTPCFLVMKPAGKGYKQLRIPKLGYHNAFVRAVSLYQEWYGLEMLQALALLARKPDPDLFTESLLPLLHDRGYELTTERLLEMLML